ncbi:hypothetical protein [Yersinia intermedia]|nr:hypothetical protein [Yersinia intermedia]MCB5297590.1 hypothetical protein [Yersinia intermedia]MDN0115026.1 hypothetical protein [Yersinia intermedia]HEN3293449.1 hypothetical protein [Yersinia enterocolitica]
MSESNKPTNENKPQPPAPQKPTPAKDGFSVGRTIVGDSADGLRKKSK